MSQRLEYNAARCETCETVVESTHRHDFRRCQCPTDDTAIWVDGGHDYGRRLWGENAKMTDLSRPEVFP